MIYFIQAGKDGPIKIGHTDNTPEKRLKELQTGNPEKLILLGYMDGDKKQEALLHQMFHFHRQNGEWFNPSETVIQQIFYLIFGIRVVNFDDNMDKPLSEILSMCEKRIISNRLEHFKGNVSKTSKSLDVNQRTLWRKIKNYNLRY